MKKTAKKPKKPKDYSGIAKDEESFKKFRHHFIMNALRKATYRWPYGHLAMKAAKIDSFYKCASCSGLFGPKEVNKDHIVSVINVETGFTTYDEVAERMFIKAEEYQILCISCHELKTFQENILRRKYGQKELRINKKKK